MICGTIFHRFLESSTGQLTGAWLPLLLEYFIQNTKAATRRRYGYKSNQQPPSVETGSFSFLNLS